MMLSVFLLFFLLCRRKTITDWETDLVNLEGTALSVEVLENVPLTMHNFVSPVKLHNITLLYLSAVALSQNNV